MPVSAFFYLEDYVKSEFPETSVRCGALVNGPGRVVTHFLDRIVDEICTELGLDPFGAAKRWRNVL